MTKYIFLIMCLCTFIPFSGAQSFFQSLIQTDYSYFYNSSSCSWGDVDADGDLDLFVTNGEYNQPNEFYLNDGRGGFTPISNAITQKSVPSFGACFGDYDNDGDLDLYVANCDYLSEEGVANFLFRNNGNGIFIKIKEGVVVEEEETSYACSWVDYDNDGWLDLFVANAYGKKNSFYKNDGEGGFVKITNGSIVNDAKHTVGCSWSDFDNDGDQDLLTLSPVSGFQDFYLNQGDGSFVKKSSGEMGMLNTQFCRSASWADFDQDGWMDLVIVDGDGKDRLYRNTQNGGFFPLEEEAFSVMESFSGNGSAWGDFDNDGDQDLILMHHFGIPKEFHQNNGDGTFTRLVETDLNYNNERITYALAAIDFDTDGRLDLFQTNRYDEGQTWGFPNSLFRNASEGCLPHLGISLKGVQSNRDGIGSKVLLYSHDKDGNQQFQKQELQCLSGGGYTAQSGMRLHFGLGEAESLDSVVVLWPSGIRTSWSELDVNTHLILSEDGGITSDQTLYAMKLDVIRDEACPGRISRLEVSNSRRSVTWYSSESDLPVATGKVFYLPPANSTTRYSAIDGCGRTVIYDASETYFESRVFPNPVRDILFLNLSAPKFARAAKLIIRDSAGKYLYEESFELTEGYSVKEVNMSRFASGTYFVEVQSACFNSVEKIVLIR